MQQRSDAPPTAPAARQLSAAEVDRLFHEAVRHFEQGQLADAEALLDRLAPIAGTDAEFLRLRGVVAAAQRDAPRALLFFEAAARQAPQIATHHFNLGSQYRLTGRPLEALDCLSRAIALEPRLLQARLMLVQVLRKLERRTEALQHLHDAAAAANEDPEALTKIAFACRELDARDAAVRTMRRAVQLAPDDFDKQVWLRKFTTESVKAWHFAMMNDSPRNAAYDTAIRRAVTPATEVLEIGTGSGLLSLMAARAGARLVTTCEMVGVIAECAEEIVRRCGYGDRIHVIPKPSTDLAVGRDLPQRADLLIAEILSDELLAENVLAATAHARVHLLKDDAQLIPRSVSAVGRIVGGPLLAQATFVGTVEGFDLRPFNRFAPAAVAIKMDTRDFESFSEDIEIFHFDLTATTHRPQERLLRFPVERSGLCVGLLQWVRLELDDITCLENRPGERFAPSAWRQMLYPFPSPFETRQGDVVTVRAKHNMISLAFALAS